MHTRFAEKRGQSKAAALAGATLLAVPGFAGASLLPNVILSDNLGSSSSTVNGASNAPTATSTNYDIASSAAALSTISGGALKISMPSSKSALAEAQALFTTSPVTLANVGTDKIQIDLTFTDQGGVGQGSAKSAIYLGLYNSAGSAPYNNLQSSGLSTATGDATGGVQNWLGYVGQTYSPLGAPVIVTRPAQSGTNNTNQDLVSNGAKSTFSYGNPVGDTLTGAGTGLTSTLNTGSQYTAEMIIALTSPSTYAITSSLYTGPDDTGTLLATTTESNTSPSDFLTSSFDGMAFGWLYSSSVSATSEMDVNSVVVSTNVPVPEPACFALLGLSGLGLLRRRRRRQ